MVGRFFPLFFLPRFSSSATALACRAVRAPLLHLCRCRGPAQPHGWPREPSPWFLAACPACISMSLPGRSSAALLSPTRFLLHADRSTPDAATLLLCVASHPSHGDPTPPYRCRGRPRGPCFSVPLDGPAAESVLRAFAGTGGSLLLCSSPTHRGSTESTAAHAQALVLELDWTVQSIQVARGERSSWPGAGRPCLSSWP